MQNTTNTERSQPAAAQAGRPVRMSPPRWTRALAVWGFAACLSTGGQSRAQTQAQPQGTQPPTAQPQGGGNPPAAPGPAVYGPPAPAPGPGGSAVQGALRTAGLRGGATPVSRYRDRLRLPRTNKDFGFQLEAPMAASRTRLILLSEMDELLLNTPQLRQAIAEGLGDPRVLKGIQAYERESLQRLVDQVTFSQAIYTLPPSRRQQLAGAVERMKLEQQDRSIQETGGVIRWREELRLAGDTPEALRLREQEQELAGYMMQYDPATQEGGREYLITPAEMRRYFDENTDLFNQPAKVDLALARFRSREDAVAAAEFWRTIPLDPTDTGYQLQELEKRWPGTITELKPQPQGKDDRMGWLLEFGSKAALAEVSEPIQKGSGFWLLRVIVKREEIHQNFADRNVQQRIRRDLATLHFRELRKRNLARYARTSVSWAPTLGKR